MAEERTFLWNAWEESMIFPIDYTSRESAQKFNQDPRGFRERVLKHYLFQDILQSLALPKDSAEKILETMPPIPVEAIPFLDCFYQLAKQTNHDYHRTIFCKKENICPEDMDRFLDEFCRELYARVAPPQDNTKPDLYAFCRHIIFQNESFRSTLLNSIWDQQITPRYEQLQELAKQVSFGDQIMALEDCLISLDRTILNLRLKAGSHAAQSSKSNKETVKESEPVLRQMLKSLLSMRKRNEPSQKKRITQKNTNRKSFSYKVPDINVDRRNTLEGAFWSLEKRNGRPSSGSVESLLPNARYAYLKYLSGVIEGQKDPRANRAYAFEKQYIDLQEYLAVSSLPSEDLANLVRKHLQQYCRQILAFCTYKQISDTHAESQSDQNHHSDNLLTSLVQTRVDQVLALFWDKVQLVTYYSAGMRMAQAYWLYENGFLKGDPKLRNVHIIQDITPEMIENNLPYQEALSFCNAFQYLWDILYPDHAPLFDEETHNFLEPDDIAFTLYCDGRVAAHFFEMDEMALSSVKEAQFLLNCHKLILDNPNRILPPKIFWETIPQILPLLLLQLMQKIVEDNVPKLVGFFQPTFTTQKREPSPQNASKK